MPTEPTIQQTTDVLNFQSTVAAAAIVRSHWYDADPGVVREKLWRVAEYLRAQADAAATSILAEVTE